MEGAQNIPNGLNPLFQKKGEIVGGNKEESSPSSSTQ